VSVTTFSTYPVQSQTATPAAQKPGLESGASVEKSYLSATAHTTRATPPPATYEASGPGVTTLALGEEDGGGMMASSGGDTIGGMSTPGSLEGGYEVTTLAIGEESSGAEMSPIYDDHSTIGGHSTIGSIGMERPASAQQSYGTMQPIYSPGEPEYPAFAKTSQTTDILNFHPVARIPRTPVVQTAPPPVPTVSVAAPTTGQGQPVAMDPAPVGTLAQPAPQSTSFESVGSYDDYLRSIGAQTAAPVATPPVAVAAPMPEPAPVMTAPIATPPPAAPVMAEPAPVMMPAEPAPIIAMPAAPAPMPAPAPVAQPVMPAPIAAPIPTVPVAAPAAPAAIAAPAPAAAPAPVAPAAPEPVKTAETRYTPPLHSAEPVRKPALHSASVAEPIAPKSDAQYVEVSIDSYLVAPEGVTEAAPAAAEAATAAAPAEPAPTPAEVAPAQAADTAPVQADTAPAAPTPAQADAAPEIAAKEPAQPTEKPAEKPAATAQADSSATPPERPSMGGSFVVMDSALPSSLTSGDAATSPTPASAESSGPSVDGLQIITLAIGEEAGGQ